MQFVSAVNRIFRQNGIIRGDSDSITDFSDTAHSSTIQIARIAVENELINLISDRLIPKERQTSGSITTVSGTRVYSLASDFTRFYGVPHFYDSSGNYELFEYPGGLEQLQIEVYNYKTQNGSPNWWYWEPGDTTYKQVGFFLVPDSALTLTYDYQGSVLVSAYTDSLPFHNTEEDYSFCSMASRRFKYMFEDTKNASDIQQILDNDMSYKSAKSALMNLLRGTPAGRQYGNAYL